MSDTALNQIIQYGTNAARIAFTPSPAVGSQVLYIWYETDNAPDTYAWNGAAWVQINNFGTGDVVGPGSSTDDAIAVFDGTTGKLLQNSIVTLIAGVLTGAIFPNTGLNVRDTGNDNVLQLKPGENLTADRVLTINVADAAQSLSLPIISNIGITIDGGGSAITTGIKGYIRIPYAGTITKVTMLADVSGSIVVDIWKDTYANYPPTDADSITAAAVPTISTALKSEDSTLTGWTTSITAGDVFGFNVDSITSITRLTLTLDVKRS